MSISSNNKVFALAHRALARGIRDKLWGHRCARGVALVIERVPVRFDVADRKCDFDRFFAGPRDLVEPAIHPMKPSVNVPERYDQPRLAGHDPTILA